MPNQLGAQAIPYAAPDGILPAGDVALGYLGQFMQAAINRACRELWDAVCPGRETVAYVFYRDPTKLFEEERLPALYLWRGRRTRSKLADGMGTKQSRIEVAWITEPAQEEHMISRDTVSNAVLDAVDEALMMQRTPEWVVPGDTDVHSAAMGSLINSYVGADTIELAEAAAKSLTFEAVDGDGKPLPYYGFAFSIDVTEHLELDPSIGAHPNAAIATYRTNGDATTDTTVNYPDEA